MFITKVLALGNQLEMETGGNQDPRDRSTSRKDPGLCQPWGEASSGPVSPVPWAPATQCWQAGHIRRDTSQGSHLAHCSSGAPGSSPPAVPTATALLAPRWPLLSSCTWACWQVQCRVHPPSQWGQRAGAWLLCSLTPRTAWSPALPASPGLKNLPWQ